MINRKSSRRKTLANSAMSSPVKTNGPNCDWLRMAPENVKARLSADTLIILKSPVAISPTLCFDSTGTVPSDEPEISDLDATLLKYEFQVSYLNEVRKQKFSPNQDGQHVWIKLQSDVWARGHIYAKLRTRQQMARTVSAPKCPRRPLCSPITSAHSRHSGP